MSRHPNIDEAITALVNGNTDAAWHLLTRIPKSGITEVPGHPASWKETERGTICTHGGYFITNGHTVEVRPGAEIIGGGILYMHGKP